MQQAINPYIRILIVFRSFGLFGGIPYFDKAGFYEGVSTRGLGWCVELPGGCRTEIGLQAARMGNAIPIEIQGFTK